LAWHCHRPIVGDAVYDGGTDAARKFRERGLFLCASRVTHQHPYYNTPVGRAEWNRLDNEHKYAGGVLWLDPRSDKVMVSASIDLPEKFHKLLAREEDRHAKFSSTLA
jgi:hypothetical protein